MAAFVFALPAWWVGWSLCSCYWGKWWACCVGVGRGEGGWVIGQCRIWNFVRHLRWSASVRVVSGFGSLIIRDEVVRLDQATRNVIFGDAEISLVVIQLGETRLKKTGFVYLLAVVWRKGREGVV